VVGHGDEFRGKVEESTERVLHLFVLEKGGHMTYRPASLLLPRVSGMASGDDIGADWWERRVGANALECLRPALKKILAEATFLTY
jgi:hypothetical protein